MKYITQVMTVGIALFLVGCSTGGVIYQIPRPDPVGWVYVGGVTNVAGETLLSAAVLVSSNPDGEICGLDFAAFPQTVLENGTNTANYGPVQLSFKLLERDHHQPSDVKIKVEVSGWADYRPVTGEAVGLIRMDDKTNKISTLSAEIQKLKQIEGMPVSNSSFLQIPLNFPSPSELPPLIPSLAEDLDLQEDPKPRPLAEGMIEYPVSVRSAHIIQRILINAPQFNKDVKTWAADQYLSKDRDEAAQFRETFRKWWRENSDAIKNQKYSEVRPLK